MNRAHYILWIEYTVLFVLLVALMPCLWVSYIWDQMIDPHYDYDNIQQPDHWLLRHLYGMALKISGNLGWRVFIYTMVCSLVILSAILDVVSETVCR